MTIKDASTVQIENYSKSFCNSYLLHLFKKTPIYIYIKERIFKEKFIAKNVGTNAPLKEDLWK